MQIVLWIIVSIAFLGSILMFIPSIMSIASPRPTSGLRKEYYWVDKVSRLFLSLVMLYPIVFFIALLCYRFLGWEVIHGLLGYVVVLLVLFLMWSKLEKIRDEK